MENIVRDYVSPQDSTVLIDYLMDLYKRTEVNFPGGLNVEDIPEIYSKKVAGLPIDFTSDISPLKGEYSRIPSGEVPGFAHDALDREIRIDSTSRTGWPAVEIAEDINWDNFQPEEFVSVLRNWKNTVLHEAFGHALPESIFGYRPKGTKGSVLSGRSEMLPYLLQAISSIGKTDEELFIGRDVGYPVGQDFDDTQLITKRAIKELEPIVESLLKNINK